MSDPEELNPNCLQIAICGIGRMVDGGLVLDTGLGGALNLLSPSAVKQVMDQYKIDPDGQRILLRLAFVDFVPNSGG